MRRMIYDELFQGLEYLHINCHLQNITPRHYSLDRLLEQKCWKKQPQYIHKFCQPCLRDNPTQRHGMMIEFECCNGFWYNGHQVCQVQAKCWKDNSESGPIYPLNTLRIMLLVCRTV